MASPRTIEANLVARSFNTNCCRHFKRLVNSSRIQTQVLYAQQIGWVFSYSLQGFRQVFRLVLPVFAFPGVPSGTMKTVQQNVTAAGPLPIHTRFPIKSLRTPEAAFYACVRPYVKAAVDLRWMLFSKCWSIFSVSRTSASDSPIIP